MTENRGAIEGRRDTDYVAGELPYEVRNPSGDWTDYLPSGERQRLFNVDTMACVSFSLLNCVETQIKFLTGQELNYSDRFLAKMSGTTIDGNYLWKVADSARKDGLVFQAAWPTPENYTWDTYYAEIPQHIKDMGKRFLEFWDINYEWIPTTKEEFLHHLKQAPLQIVKPGHAVMGFYQPSDVTKYFDSYLPYLKEINTDEIRDALKIIVKKKPMNQAKIIKSKNSETVYWCYPMPSMAYLNEKASLEGVAIPETIPDSDTL